MQDLDIKQYSIPIPKPSLSVASSSLEHPDADEQTGRWSEMVRLAESRSRAV
jgi:hypothetical protein